MSDKKDPEQGKASEKENSSGLKTDQVKDALGRLKKILKKTRISGQTKMKTLMKVNLPGRKAIPNR